MAGQSISTLNVKLTADGRALLSEFAKTQQAVKGWAAQIEGVKKSLGTLVSADLIAQSIRSLSGAVKEFVGESLKAAADLETYKLQFETIFQSAEKAKKVIQEIYDFGDRTPFQSKDLIEASKQLAGYGVNAEHILPTLKTLGDIAAVSGASLGDLSQIYGRIVSDGRAMNEDLNRLADRSIPIYSELAKVIGVSTAEVRKLASEGKITSQQVQQAFIAMTTGAGQYSGAIEKLADTSAGKWSTFLDSIEAIKRAFGEGLLPQATELTQVITELVNGGDQAKSTFDSWRDAGEALGTTLRAIAGTIQLIRAALVELDIELTYFATAGFDLKTFKFTKNDAMIEHLRKQRDDLYNSSQRMFDFSQPMTPPKANTGPKQAGIESILPPAEQAAAAVKEAQAAANAFDPKEVQANVGDAIKEAMDAIDYLISSATSNIQKNQKTVDKYYPTREEIIAEVRKVAGEAVSGFDKLSPDQQKQVQDAAANEALNQINEVAAMIRSNVEKAKQDLQQWENAPTPEAVSGLAVPQSVYETVDSNVIEAARQIVQKELEAAAKSAEQSAAQSSGDSPVSDAVKQLQEDIRANIDEARKSLAEIDQYLGRTDAPSPEKIAERAGTINYGDYQAGKYGSMTPSEYFNARDEAVKQILTELQSAAGVMPDASKATVDKSQTESLKASQDTAKSVDKMSSDVVAAIGQEQSILERMAVALERRRDQLEVKVFAV